MRQIDKQTQRLLDEYKHGLKNNIQEYPTDVQNAMRCIHQNLFDQNLTVNWLKKNCHITNNNFSGKFKFYTGIGVKKYILKLRLQAAKLLMLDNIGQELSISEIGYEIGFSSYASFNRAFSKSYGKPPGQWLEEKC